MNSIIPKCKHLKFDYYITGSICSMENGIVTERFKGFTATNGICLSPNEKIIYTVDSYESEIIGQEIDISTGTVDPVKKTIFKFKPHDYGYDSKSILDGMVSDVRGNLWVVLYMPGKVINLDVETGMYVAYEWLRL